MKFLFRTLINQHHKLLYSQAYHILGNATEAEDATQQAYEKLWRNMSSIDEHIAKAWLLRVNKHICIDQLRKRKAEEPLAEHDHLESKAQQPTAALASKQISLWLTRLIGQLKEPYRSIITLSDVQQQTIKTIAATMAMNENQVKVYIHRGRKQLKEQLQGVEL